MTARNITPPYPVFLDRDGTPLDNGFVFIGVENLEPVTNPLPVYWDEALTISAAQPIRTINGYPSRAGTPSQLYADADFSITVRDSRGLFVYNSMSVTDTFDTLRTDLAGPSGSSLVGFLQSGTGAVARTVQGKLRDTVSLTDWDVKGDGVTDDTAEIQKACDFCAVAKKTLFVPTPSVGYLITAKINVNCPLVGEAPIDPVIGVAQFVSKTNINMMNVYGSRLVVENIGLRYELGALATSASIGFLFGNATTQFSRCLVRNCFVRYAYDSFKANTAGAVGTLWMNRFENCSSDLHVHYGFDFLCLAGSTTLMLDGIYSIGDDSGGNLPLGIRIQNVIGASAGLLAIDKAYNSALDLNTCSFSARLIQLESCYQKTASSSLIRCTSSSATIQQIKSIGRNVDIGAGNNCGIISPPGSGNTLVCGQILEQSTTTVSGTPYKYRIGAIAVKGLIITDGLCASTDIYGNGYDVAVQLNGRHYAPTPASFLGSWVKGDFIHARTPVEAGVAPNKYVKIGWTRVTDGATNVLNTDWLEARVLTGN